MIELNGEKLKRYELNRTVTVAPNHGNRLHEVRVQQSEATEPITVPTREENGKMFLRHSQYFHGTVRHCYCRSHFRRQARL